MALTDFRGLPPRAAAELRLVPGLNYVRGGQLRGFGEVSLEATADAVVAQTKKVIADAKSVANSILKGSAVARTNVAALEKDFTAWSTTLRQWAKGGKKATTGSAYSWADWATQGKVIADGAAYQAGQSIESSLFDVLKKTTKATASDVKKGAVAVATATYSALPYAGIAAAGLGALWLFLAFRKQAHLNGLEGARRLHGKRRRSRKGKR
jgi:hypothetical protein